MAGAVNVTGMLPGEMDTSWTSRGRVIRGVRSYVPGARPLTSTNGTRSAPRIGGQRGCRSGDGDRQLAHARQAGDARSGTVADDPDQEGPAGGGGLDRYGDHLRVGARRQARVGGERELDVERGGRREAGNVDGARPHLLDGRRARPAARRGSPPSAARVIAVHLVAVGDASRSAPDAPARSWWSPPCARRYPPSPCRVRAPPAAPGGRRRRPGRGRPGGARRCRSRRSGRARWRARRSASWLSGPVATTVVSLTRGVPIARPSGTSPRSTATATSFSRCGRSRPPQSRACSRAPRARQPSARTRDRQRLRRGRQVHVVVGEVDGHGEGVRRDARRRIGREPVADVDRPEVLGERIDRIGLVDALHRDAREGQLGEAAGVDETGVEDRGQRQRPRA